MEVGEQGRGKTSLEIFKNNLQTCVLLTHLKLCFNSPIMSTCSYISMEILRIESKVISNSLTMKFLCLIICSHGLDH